MGRIAAGPRTVDLTRGGIAGRVILFSLPILAGYVFQTLYNNVDSLVVGNFVGKEALAAINACTPIYNLLVGFFLGMSTGASVIFSRSLGSGDYARLRESIHTTVLFAVALGLLMGAAGVALVPLILRLLNCPPDTVTLTGDYLRIYIAGILFTAFYNVGAAVLRAVGDSRSPFYALVAGSIVNIILDILFVGPFGWGVAGAAAATVLGQAVSVVMVLWETRRMDPRYRLELRRLRINWALLREIVRLGLPAGVQSGLIAVSNIFVNRYINGFGSSLMAGVGVAQKIDRFIMMPCQALGLASTTFVSQNLGAEKEERIRKGLLVCLGLGFGSVIVMGGTISFGARWLVGLFNRDAQVVAYGSSMIRLLAPFYLLTVVAHVTSGCLRGYGYSGQVMILSLLGMVLVRQIYLAVFLRLYPLPVIIFAGYPVGWFFDALNQVLFALFLIRRGTLKL